MQKGRRGGIGRGGSSAPTAPNSPGFADGGEGSWREIGAWAPGVGGDVGEGDRQVVGAWATGGDVDEGEGVGEGDWQVVGAWVTGGDAGEGGWQGGVWAGFGEESGPRLTLSRRCVSGSPAPVLARLAIPQPLHASAQQAGGTAPAPSHPAFQLGTATAPQQPQTATAS